MRTKIPNTEEFTWQRPKLWEIPRIDSIIYEMLPSAEAAFRDRLQEITQAHSDARFASSLAVEDMVITDMIAKYNLSISIFTLDTGRLNAETLTFLADMRQRYDIAVYQYSTTAAMLFDKDNGSDAMYQSLDLRKCCCAIRKIKPLDQALAGAQAWLTGQRREQAVTRSELPFVEDDLQRGIKKYNPIADWSETLVWAYIKKKKVPYNPLYRKGYPSIGCEPCTKSIRAGEDIRSGRWWWEQKENKECGLHNITNDRKNDEK